MAKNSGNNKSFWDKPFGGLVDFNRDGNISKAGDAYGYRKW